MSEFLLGGALDATSRERTGDLTTVGSGELTTHAVIVGMTGSGKTGLGVVLIEEALRSGVPTLIIDPKGDLTNLALTFPALAPADFEPWVNEGDARRAGKTVPEFAASQASLWKSGLAGWGLGNETIAQLRRDVDFTIYTPGSSSGVGLNIVGSLAAPRGAGDPELVADEIEGFVSGLLGLIGVEADPLASREHILLSNLVQHAWGAGRDLDLATLVGMVQSPPLRKLGVFELEAFFPAKERTALALRLNGLLASPSFGSWLQGPPLDVGAMLRGPGGAPRCAIVTTAHLGDQERQFVTTLVLSKLVTWMRQQSGTSDLRALLYMDEVAGYLPPTAMPPTKKPILTLMKQARAFGVGVVLSTQNPVDVDYKALSNAGTWMVGRLQTEQDKQRLLDGMASAAGGADVGELGRVLGGLGKREFLLKRAARDTPELFTTRWAMSYLRGPLTRDQIARLKQGAAQGAPERGGPAARAPSAVIAGAAAGKEAGALPVAGVGAMGGGAAPAVSAANPADGLGPDETALMPEVASGIPVHWVDVAAPWLAEVGGVADGTRREAAVVARVSLRYDDTRADLVHDEVYEAVLFPLPAHVDASRAAAVDHDARDLQPSAPAGVVYRLPRAPVATRAYWSRLERELVDHLVRSRTVELQVNPALKLYSRPGEGAETFAQRCAQAADAAADVETSRLRTRYEARALKLQSQLRAAEGQAEVAREQASGRRNEELLSAASSLLGGLLGGRKSRGSLVGSLLGKASSAASRRSRTSAASTRAETAEEKLADLRAQLEALETELAGELTAIDGRWASLGREIGTVQIPLERTDVKVTQLVLAWIPVA